MNALVLTRERGSVAGKSTCRMAFHTPNHHTSSLNGISNLSSPAQSLALPFSTPIANDYIKKVANSFFLSNNQTELDWVCSMPNITCLYVLADTYVLVALFAPWFPVDLPQWFKVLTPCSI